MRSTRSAGFAATTGCGVRRFVVDAFAEVVALAVDLAVSRDGELVSLRPGPHAVRRRKRAPIDLRTAQIYSVVNRATELA
jgi:hypothetical protein